MWAEFHGEPLLFGYDIETHGQIPAKKLCNFSPIEIWGKVTKKQSSEKASYSGEADMIFD